MATTIRTLDPPSTQAFVLASLDTLSTPWDGALFVSIFECTHEPKPESFVQMEGRSGMFAQRIELPIEANSSFQLRCDHVILGMRLLSSLITMKISPPTSNVDLHLPVPTVTSHWLGCTWPSAYPRYQRLCPPFASWGRHATPISHSSLRSRTGEALPRPPSVRLRIQHSPNTLHSCFCSLPP
jgi:hypothetical protein